MRAASSFEVFAGSKAKSVFTASRLAPESLHCAEKSTGTQCQLRRLGLLRGLLGIAGLFPDPRARSPHFRHLRAP